LPKSALSPRLCRASAAPRPENSDSDEKDTLFGLNTQITILIAGGPVEHIFWPIVSRIEKNVVTGGMPEKE
jgi:hypothetical protein